MMALQVNYRLGNTSIIINDTYRRVAPQYYYGKDKIKIVVTTYKDATEALANKPIPHSEKDYYCFSTDPSWDLYFTEAKIAEEGNTLIKACYTYLKTLPEYGGAIDV